MKLYSVTHLRPRGQHTEWPLVDLKQIGYFTSETEARRAIRSLRLDPGFRRFLDQFRIEIVDVDVDLYETGFNHEDDRGLVPVD
jgi:hypothetical protein